VVKLEAASSRGWDKITTSYSWGTHLAICSTIVHGRAASPASWDLTASLALMNRPILERIGGIESFLEASCPDVRRVNHELNLETRSSGSSASFIPVLEAPRGQLMCEDSQLPNNTFVYHMKHHRGGARKSRQFRGQIMFPGLVPVFRVCGLSGLSDSYGEFGV
jgi:hypothetical protein